MKPSKWMWVMMAIAVPGLSARAENSETNAPEQAETQDEGNGSWVPLVVGGVSAIAGGAYIISQESDADDNKDKATPLPPPPPAPGPGGEDDGGGEQQVSRSVQAGVIGAEIPCSEFCKYDEYAAELVPIQISVELTITEDGDEVVDSAYYILPVVPGNANNDPTCPKYGGNRIDITDQVRADPSILDGGAELNVNWGDYCP